MAASPGSAAASEGGPYAPPQTCEAFETAEGSMALRLGLDIKTWTLNQDTVGLRRPGAGGRVSARQAARRANDAAEEKN